MSFADSLREELSEVTVKKNCCRKALAAGFLVCAVRTSAARTTLRCRSESAGRSAADVLARLYAKTPDILPTGAHGHHYWDITMDSPACAKLVTALHTPHTDFDALLHLDACESCRSAFLRGLFFVAGTVNDPQKASHLEFLLPQDVADATAAFLEGCGYPPRRIKRPAGVGLYYKDNTSVSDLVTMMGAHSIIFEYYNARIAGDIRNNENRATNCVTRNIEKSISAAAKQIDAIGRLMEHGKLDSLPEPLRVTALLRYRNPDATLDELKELHKPPISKSGLNHRLQKLLDAAEQ